MTCCVRGASWDTRGALYDCWSARGWSSISMVATFRRMWTSCWHCRGLGITQHGQWLHSPMGAAGSGRGYECSAGVFTLEAGAVPARRGVEKGFGAGGGAASTRAPTGGGYVGGADGVGGAGLHRHLTRLRCLPTDQKLRMAVGGLSGTVCRGTGAGEEACAKVHRYGSASTGPDHGCAAWCHSTSSAVAYRRRVARRPATLPGTAFPTDRRSGRANA